MALGAGFNHPAPRHALARAASGRRRKFITEYGLGQAPRHHAPEATGAFLKAVSKFKGLAKKVHAREEAQPPFVRRSPRHEDAALVLNATREDRIDAGKRLLSRRLQVLALKSVDMVDDGNCQLRAISMELYNTQEYHADVRRTVCAYLEAHEDSFAAFVGDGDSWRAYLARMAQDRSWGDELTLQAACAAYDLDIFVITTEEEHYHLHYSSPSGAPSRSIFPSYISPIHYNVVCPLR